MKKLIRALIFGLIGFGLLWLLGAAEECTRLQRASAYAYSENAQRFELSEPISAEHLAECVDPRAVLYCDLGEHSVLRGVWLGSKAGTPISMVSGSFLTADQSHIDAHVCTAGKQVAEDADENAGKREMEIAGNQYVLTGIAGLADLATPLDDLLFLPMQCAYEQFRDIGSGVRFGYTADGPKSAVASTLSALEERGVQIQVWHPRTVTLEHAYSRTLRGTLEYAFSRTLSVSTWYISMFAVVCGVLVLFIWFEVRARARDILAYQSSGANFFQMICLMLGKPLLISYGALAAGEILAWVIWSILLCTMPGFGPALTGAAATGLCVFAGTLMAVLVVRHAQKASPNAPGSRQIRNALFAFLAMCSAFLLVFVNGFLSTADAGRQTQISLETRSELNLHSLTGACSPNEYDAFFYEPGSLSRMKALHTELRSRPDTPYVDYIMQSIYLDAPQLPADFWMDPEQKTQLYARQIGKGFMDLTDLQVSSGRTFADTDFIANGNATIPVILGAGYAPYFTTGDRIEGARYISKNCTLEVIGMLVPGSYDTSTTYPELLDYMMIMPALEYENDPVYGSDEWFYQSCVCSQKLQGFFVLRDDAELAELMAWVGELTEKYGTYPLQFCATAPASMSVMLTMGSRYLQITLTALGIICTLIIALFVQTQRYVYQTERAEYEALRVSGASFAQMFWYASKSGLLLIAGANLIAWSVTELFLGIPYLVWTAVISTTVIVLCVVLSMRRTLRKEYVG